MNILDLLYPKFCLGCGRWGSYFCPNCLSQIHLHEIQKCPVCSRSAYHGSTHPICGKHQLDGTISLYQYSGVLRKVITHLKYRFLADLSQTLATIIVKDIRQNHSYLPFLKSSDWYLIPVPLNSKRQKWRGFNQSELIGKIIAHNLHLKFLPNLLVRSVNTLPQVKLDRKQRLQNVRNIFSFNSNSNYPLSIINSKFIIFDDVLTTGATLNECAKVLKQAGADQVWGLTIAR